MRPMYTDAMRLSKREEFKKFNMALLLDPLIFSTSGAATTTFKRLASLISEKQQQQQNHCTYQTPAELFVGQIFSDVPWRSTILLPPPNETRL